LFSQDSVPALVDLDPSEYLPMFPLPIDEVDSEIAEAPTMGMALLLFCLLIAVHRRKSRKAA